MSMARCLTDYGEDLLWKFLMGDFKDDPSPELVLSTRLVVGVDSLTENQLRSIIQDDWVKTGLPIITPAITWRYEPDGFGIRNIDPIEILNTTSQPVTIHNAGIYSEYLNVTENEILTAGIVAKLRFKEPITIYPGQWLTVQPGQLGLRITGEFVGEYESSQYVLAPVPFSYLLQLLFTGPRYGGPTFYPPNVALNPGMVDLGYQDENGVFTSVYNRIITDSYLTPLEPHNPSRRGNTTEWLIVASADDPGVITHAGLQRWYIPEMGDPISLPLLTVPLHRPITVYEDTNIVVPTHGLIMEIR